MSEKYCLNGYAVHTDGWYCQCAVCMELRPYTQYPKEDPNYEVHRIKQHGMPDGWLMETLIENARTIRRDNDPENFMSEGMKTGEALTQEDQDDLYHRLERRFRKWTGRDMRAYQPKTNTGYMK